VVDVAPEHREHRTDPVDRRAAVSDLSRDPDQEFFADGTTETLISSLAQPRT
jgi:TolB-like protein